MALSGRPRSVFCCEGAATGRKATRAERGTPGPGRPWYAALPGALLQQNAGQSRPRGRCLAALADPAARPNLLGGAHSLWYEYVCLRLNQALVDLESAVTVFPDTVSRAIRSELEAEKHGLQTRLAEFSGASSKEPDTERCWEFRRPFVTTTGWKR